MFEAELEQAINYIETQLENPTAYEPVPSRVDREHPYYRIYVGNYIVFYCVIRDMMELRRFVYARRDWRKIV